MTIRTSWRTGSVIFLAAASTAFAQTGGGAAAGSDGPVFKQEELEQLVAPIALYPDSLVAQVLMASTYPLEVVQAERWAKQNKSLKADALAAALEKQPWDPSVKSLVNFPQVLTMMSEQLDWTTNLGDAFLAQQKDVMGAVQKLRNKAKSEGNLETTEQQTVVVKEEAQTQVIVIESADPQVIYVPTYNPTVVYGAWPYPAYPPYYYYPPGYVAGTAALSFGIGVACGAVWANNGWGSCNWGHGDVDIDVRGGNSFNRIDNSRNASNVGNRNNNVQGGRNSWQHDPSHRKGAAYRDQNTAKKFGGASTADAAKARDSYRGRADAGRQDIARGGADQYRRGQSPAGAGRDQGAGSPSANRPQAQDRSASPAQNRGGAADRPSQSSGNRGGAFDGAGQGQSARQESSRGQASRSSPSRSSSGGSSSRGGGGGGGSRGGMSGGGGGGRGGRGAGYEDPIYWP